MNVGDYCRTKKGILKIRDDKPFKDDKNKLNYLTYGNYTCVLKENIIKSSPNIIDLIKEGDCVNGHIVCQVFYENQTIDNIKYIDLEGVNILVCNDDIKSIITKEQFESMEYKVGE